jgi:YHS domain-containing protein/predicted small secreted protein
MKTKIAIAIFAVASLTFASCSNDKSGSAAGREDKKPAGTTGEYPLTTCVVSGEELGSMGKPVEHDYKGTTVKFCCKSCIPEFEEAPETFIAKLKP